MKYFFDTEFIEDFHKPLFGKRRHYIDLISIGIVADDGRTYYAVSNEFDVDHVWNKWQFRRGQGDRNNTNPREYWLRENVLNTIHADLAMLEDNPVHEPENWFTLWSMKSLIKKYGKSNKQIASDIEAFVYTTVEVDRHKNINTHPASNIIIRDKPEFYAYYADYDWVLFCSIFGKMLDLPDGFPMYCRDIKQMIDERVLRAIKNQNRPNSETEFKAQLSALKLWKEYPKETNSHNALADAKWNKQLFEFIKSLG